MENNAQVEKDTLGEKLEELMGKEIYQEPTQGLSHGVNFVTVCTQDRVEMFGEIVEGNMIRNDYGNIVQSCWDEIPRRSNVLGDISESIPNAGCGIRTI